LRDFKSGTEAIFTFSFFDLAGMAFRTTETEPGEFFPLHPELYIQIQAFNLLSRWRKSVIKRSQNVEIRK